MLEIPYGLFRDFGLFDNVLVLFIFLRFLKSMQVLPSKLGCTDFARDISDCMHAGHQHSFFLDAYRDIDHPIN